MVTMEIFGIGGSELFLLLILGVILVGPEKLPELSRRAAKTIYVVRTMARQATSEVKKELGPEFADLTIEDLNPKTFVRKRLLEDLDLDDIQRDLQSVTSEVNDAVRGVNESVLPTAGGAVVASKTPSDDEPLGTPEATVIGTVPFDSEAT